MVFFEFFQNFFEPKLMPIEAKRRKNQFYLTYDRSKTNIFSFTRKKPRSYFEEKACTIVHGFFQNFFEPKLVPIEAKRRKNQFYLTYDRSKTNNFSFTRKKPRSLFEEKACT